MAHNIEQLHIEFLMDNEDVNSDEARQHHAEQEAWHGVVQATNDLDDALYEVRHATNAAERHDAVEKQKKAGAALLAADAEYERIVNGA